MSNSQGTPRPNTRFRKQTNPGKAFHRSTLRVFSHIQAAFCSLGRSVHIAPALRCTVFKVCSYTCQFAETRALWAYLCSIGPLSMVCLRRRRTANQDSRSIAESVNGLISCRQQPASCSRTSTELARQQQADMLTASPCPGSLHKRREPEGAVHSGRECSRLGKEYAKSA